MKFKAEQRFARVASEKREKAILESFSSEEQKKIAEVHARMSLIPKYIGQDFDMPVELNTPGGGWHWDFEHNVVRVDPKDILEKPVAYLKFVLAHEGGHRRVSRVDFIPKEVWNQQGFPFMMNAIEDPRMNNFVAQVDPVFKEHMDLAYTMDIDFEERQKDEAQEKLGFQPRFMQAGFEYIKQWFREVKDKEFDLSEGLPDEVRTVVEQTLESAQDSWLRYPTRKEADSGEEMITAYAKKSYEINRDEVWPLFKTLVEQDAQDQKVQEMLQDMMEGEQGEEGGEGGDQQGGGHDIPQELQETLSEEEQKNLEDAIEQALQGDVSESEDNSSESSPVDIESLSDSLKQKIKEYIDSLPPEQQQEIEQKAEESLKEFEQDLNDAFEKKLTEESEESKKMEEAFKEREQKGNNAEEQDIDTEDLKDSIRSIVEKNKIIYDKYYEEVVPLINQLTNELRNIFRERRNLTVDAGLRRGRSIDIRKRIREVATDVSAHKTRAFEKKKLPAEKDYAVSLLVDLSGSMRGEKIEETCKAVIVLAEVLNRLSIKTEIVGFNDRLHEFQKYGDDFSKEVREKMGTMLQEVSSERARYNDDGWALQQISERLEKQKATQKFIIALSDGQPEESPQHSGGRYDLKKSVKNITRETDQKLIGLGLLSSAVRDYYPNNISDVNIQEMTEQIATLITSIIKNPQQY